MARRPTFVTASKLALTYIRNFKPTDILNSKYQNSTGQTQIDLHRVINQLQSHSFFTQLRRK